MSITFVTAWQIFLGGVVAGFAFCHLVNDVAPALNHCHARMVIANMVTKVIDITVFLYIYLVTFVKT
jgi:hypothetical protein